MIDLRSDTVTKPTPGMREAMLHAEVGDDVFGEDPTVIALEGRMAALFGHEAGLFCSSGTQTNQIAINVHTRPGDEVLCEVGAHIYQYEGGGLMANSGCSVKFIPAEFGRFVAAEVETRINDLDNPHLPRTRLVNVENTSNRGGGAVWDINEVRRIRETCSKHGLILHMDGARIFNALAIDGKTASEWGALFDSVSICLSKGLGAPVGSVLVGPRSFIQQARRVRKRFGGGMRQAGILAAAGLYALDHHVARLAQDHARAKRLADALRAAGLAESILPVETNIVVFNVAGGSENGLLAKLKTEGVLAVRFGPGMVRMVTHLDVDDAAIDHVVDVLQRIAT
jgi:threonine aldolase